jgi:hypothetical protein
MGELSEPGSREIDGQARGRVSGRRSSQLISDFELPIADRGRRFSPLKIRPNLDIDIAQAFCDDRGSTVEAQLMNWKRFIFAFVAAYIFLFLWGWLLNGMVLKDVYAETPNLWRTQSEMLSLFHWIIIGQALIVFSFVMIYASGFAGRGVIAGVRLGVLLEIAAIGMRMGFYAVQPIPGKLLFYGSMSGLIEMVIVGAMVGAIYKPAATQTL